jgi:polyisoprenoid-binding protein YceI
MNKLILSTVVLPLAFAAGCSNPADKVPAAQVSTSTNASSPAVAAQNTEARTFAFGPANSKIDFVGSKVTGSHDGGFTNFVGELRVVGGKVADTGNRVVISTDSLWSDNPRLTGHLKNADFFNVPVYPTATFETVSVSDGATNSTVVGNLTMHGITKQISFPATIKVADNQVSVNAEFSINRFDFDMKYAGRADDLIRKEVVLKLNVNAAPGKADFSAIEKAPAAAAGH